MIVEAQVEINAKKEEIWKVISDIENSTKTIRGIDMVEILERPDNGLVGLKWRETRTMLGQSATEVMWVTQAKENEFYEVQAESCGCLYTSTLTIKTLGREDSCKVKMTHDSQAQSFIAKIFAIPMGYLMRGGSMQKAFLDDLTDVKQSLEQPEKSLTTD